MPAHRLSALGVDTISIGFYPDEGDAGGTKTYLSHLNAALSSNWPSPHRAPVINVVGWYAQTYPGEEFTGSQLMPLVQDIKAEYVRCGGAVRMVYEASVMPFQSWTGYTRDNPRKAQEVARVMQALLDASSIDDDFAIAEIRLRFGHEVNYYTRSGLYPPPTGVYQGADFREAFDQVALACRALPGHYSRRIKMFWCPNIASTASRAMAEYERFQPTMEYVGYVGIDYYCPAPGCLDAADFVRKMKPLHDKYASRNRPFILGETGLHFDATEGKGTQAKLKWLHVVTGREARSKLPHLSGVSWFNYEKDRDYRLIYVGPTEAAETAAFAQWLHARMAEEDKTEKRGGKVKKLWKTLMAG
jgi:hypothetical protein